MSKILIIEDDVKLSETLLEWLELQSHTPEAIHDGLAAYERLSLCKYDVIIADWNLPGMSGVELVRRFRADGGKTPILMLTGRGELAEKTAGLDAGADDYLSKPFHMTELGARVRALLRRSPHSAPPKLQVKDIVLDPADRTVTRNGSPVRLTPRDFELLEFLMRHPGQIFSNDALMERVWHSESESTSYAVRSAIKRLRAVLEDDQGTIIENIPKVGYRLR